MMTKFGATTLAILAACANAKEFTATMDESSCPIVEEQAFMYKQCLTNIGCDTSAVTNCDDGSGVCPEACEVGFNRTVTPATPEWGEWSSCAAIDWVTCYTEIERSFSTCDDLTEILVGPLACAETTGCPYEGIRDGIFSLDCVGNIQLVEQTCPGATCPALAEAWLTRTPSPTQSPVTPSPTQSPVTPSPTQSPVTPSPTQSPTDAPVEAPKEEEEEEETPSAGAQVLAGATVATVVASLLL